MKSKICLLLTVLCALIFAPVNIRAGDYSTLNFIGFSNNGKYLAFEEYGTHDGSGYPFANIYFVDVEKNAFVGKPFEVVPENEKATEETARKKVAAAAARRMRELKIVPGNTGRLLLAHLLTDETAARAGADTERRKVRFTTDAYPDGQNDFLELTLNSIKVKPAKCDDDAGIYTFYKFELTLDSYSGDEKKIPTEFLQKDAFLPASRDCPTSYRIERVYFYKERIAVFLNVFYRGFEGPNMRYMIVSGKLPDYY